MLDISAALDIVLDNTPESEIVQVDLLSAHDHYLAEEIRANSDIPPFDRSAMDGYALRSEDARRAPVLLQVIGESRAGDYPDFAVSAGQAARIMTGGVVPVGADCVQMVEKTEILDGGKAVRILEPVQPGANIAPRGSEVKAGQVVLERGRYIGAGEIAVLATFGYTRAKVWKRPQVAVLSTGDELVEVDRTPQPGQIRNSNAYTLQAQLRALGIEPQYLGIARDDKDDLKSKIRLGLQRDILIMTGGVSMGAYDFVEEVYAELDIKIIFNQVRIKPGKPAVFAKRENKLVFGLPGNPVSAFVTFEYFVRPAILKMIGCQHPTPPLFSAQLRAEMRQKPGRTAFVAAWTEWSAEAKGWVTTPLPFKGSSDIVNYSRANSMIIFPHDVSEYSTGNEVKVMLLPDYLRRVKLI